MIVLFTDFGLEGPYTGQMKAVLAREESAFLARWGHVVDSVDPASHPWLSRTGNPFLFAKHPRPAAPRLGWRD